MPRGMLSSSIVLFFRLSVRERECVRASLIVLLTRYLINQLWEFHQIYSFGTVWDKDKVITFSGEKVKGHGQSETIRGHISTLVVIFSPVSGMHGCILMKLITVTHYQVLMTSQGHGFRDRGLRQHFSGKSTPVNSSP